MRRGSIRALAGLLAAACTLAFWAAPRRAAADGGCDWLRPDSDMRQLFPEADDYHPVYKRPFEKRDQIESRLGYKLWGWENLIPSYTIMKRAHRIGTLSIPLTPSHTHLLTAITHN